jgi:hypothetical protein
MSKKNQRDIIYKIIDEDPSIALFPYIQYNILRMYKKILEGEIDISELFQMIERVGMLPEFAEREKEYLPIIQNYLESESPNKTKIERIIKNKGRLFWKQIMYLIQVFRNKMECPEKIPVDKKVYPFLFHLFQGKKHADLHLIDRNTKNTHRHSPNPIRIDDPILYLHSMEAIEEEKKQRYEQFKENVEDIFDYYEYMNNEPELFELLFKLLMKYGDWKVYQIWHHVHTHLEKYTRDETLFSRFMVEVMYIFLDIRNETKGNIYEIIKKNINQDRTDEITIFYHLFFIIALSIQSGKKFCEEDVYEQIDKITYSLQNSESRKNEVRDRFEILTYLIHERIMNIQYSVSPRKKEKKEKIRIQREFIQSNENENENMYQQNGTFSIYNELMISNMNNNLKNIKQIIRKEEKEKRK